MLKVPVLQAEPPDAAHGGDDALHDVSFECYNLPNMDTLSKTDAMVGAGARPPPATPFSPWWSLGEHQ